MSASSHVWSDAQVKTFILRSFSVSVNYGPRSWLIYAHPPYTHLNEHWNIHDFIIEMQACLDVHVHVCTYIEPTSLCSLDQCSYHQAVEAAQGLWVELGNIRQGKVSLPT